jgi:long-chain acyl-CoA synthetase
MEITRLFDIPYYQLEKFPQKSAIAGKPCGKLISYSTEELIKTINEVSLGLLDMGVKAGDKIALISYANRPEWNIMDLAMLQIGAINVPVYPTISPREYVYIFNDAEVKFCVVGDGDLLKKVKEAQPQVPSLKIVFTFDEVGEVPHWEALFKQNPSAELLAELENRKNAIKPQDMATIIYTSGTTGNPKGVMLSHENICSNVIAVKDIIPTKAGDTTLSFLPLCHIFERTVIYTYLSIGVSIRYAQSVDTLRDELVEVRPHFFTTVPRLLEKVYERVYSTAMQGSPTKKKIFLWAVGLTENYTFDRKPSFFEGIQLKIADKIVFSKIRARVGGNLKGIVTGAAACPTKIARFFSAIGIPVREAYGLTETSPGLTGNRFVDGQCMLGTVGPVFDNVTVKIEEDSNYGAGEGEILAKGPNIMMGYYNKPTETAEVIDKDGWFHTGDVGKFVTNSKGVQFLKITDRKKELLKTSNGKYIAPSPIESKFKEDFLVEQMMVLGDGEKFASALIIPAAEPLKMWCEENSIAWTTLAEVLKNEQVIAYYQTLADKLNQDFAHVEQIKKFRLLPDAWDVSTGELTPTMKLKRRVVMDKYKDVIAEIYG